jgi:hypothetical protein
MEPEKHMIDLTELTETDRTLVLEFATVRREIDTTRLLYKDGPGKQLIDKLAPWVQKSHEALEELKTKTSHGELLGVVFDAMDQKTKAIKQLRKLARRIQQD